MSPAIWGCGLRSAGSELRAPRLIFSDLWDPGYMIHGLRALWAAGSPHPKVGGRWEDAPSTDACEDWIILHLSIAREQTVEIFWTEVAFPLSVLVVPPYAWLMTRYTPNPDIRNQKKMLGKKFLTTIISYTVYKKLCTGDLAKMFLTTRVRDVDPWRQFFECAIHIFVHVTCNTWIGGPEKISC